MPSVKVLEQKKQYVEELTEKIKSATAGVLIDYKGINVADDTTLRKELREAGVEYRVIKNSILRYAFTNAGYDFNNVLEGTTALALHNEDPVIAAKIASKYSEKIKNGYNLKAGFVDGEVLDTAKVVELGNLPSKEQLVGQLLSVLTGNIRGLAVALNAIAEKEEA